MEFVAWILTLRMRRRRAVSRNERGINTVFNQETSNDGSSVINDVEMQNNVATEQESSFNVPSNSEISANSVRLEEMGELPANTVILKKEILPKRNILALIYFTIKYFAM